MKIGHGYVDMDEGLLIVDWSRGSGGDLGRRVMFDGVWVDVVGWWCCVDMRRGIECAVLVSLGGMLGRDVFSEGVDDEGRKRRVLVGVWM